MGIAGSSILTAPVGGTNRFRIAFHDAWRGISLRELAWTLAIALTFMLAHAYSLNTAPGRNWPVPIRSYEWFYLPASLIFLVAFRFAEHPQIASIPRWRRYAMALTIAALLYSLATGVGMRLVPREHHSFTSGAAAFFWGSVQNVLLTMIVALVYSSLMRSRRAQAAFDAAALERAASGRRVAAARLATQQARLEPTFLFSSLELIDVLYERDPDAAERTLASLIDFLRTALPKVGEEGSTLGREVHLARAYLSIVGARMGSRLEVAVDVPEALEAASFPAMVLVPLVERAVRLGLEPLPHGGRVEIRASMKAGRLEVVVGHSGAAVKAEAAWLEALRERVVGIYGDAAHLSVASGAQGSESTVDLPHEIARREVLPGPATAPAGG